MSTYEEGNIFLGFGRFSSFREHLDNTRPVNVQLIEEGEAGGHGIVYKTAAIICSQSQSKTREIYYHLWQVAQWQEVGGEVLSKRHENRADSGLKLTQSLLSNFKIIPAVIATPKDLKIMQGTNDLLDYNQEADLFYLITDTKNGTISDPAHLQISDT